jgi:hypothetical protein
MAACVLLGEHCTAVTSSSSRARLAATSKQLQLSMHVLHHPHVLAYQHLSCLNPSPAAAAAVAAAAAAAAAAAGRLI